MENLRSLLERFRESLDKDSLTREVIQEAIRDKTKIEIKKGDLNLKNGILEITTTAAAKNEIVLKESYIKSALIERGIKISRIYFK